MSSLSLSPALDIPISSESNSSATIAETLSLKTDDHRFYNWLFDCHGFWHNFFLILSSALFLLYLAFQAKKCYTKLCNGRSHIINSYYGIVWLVTLLNFAWCCLQVFSLIWIPVFSVFFLGWFWCMTSIDFRLITNTQIGKIPGLSTSISGSI